MTMDTLRADRVSFYSRAHLQTPHFDALAAKSVVFTRAFAHAPTTLPSHTNILLGTTPFYHGVHDNANFVVQPEFLSLAELLHGQGYRTGAFVGGFPLESRFGLDQGFDVYDDDFNEPEADIEKGRERRADKVVTRARDWLSHQRSPWFLWVHCFDPHDPYTPPEPYRTRFATSLYDGEVAYTDSVIGNFLRHLLENGYLKSTVIVFTADHGESLGEHGEKTHGYLAYNTTLWVPLTIFAPGFKHLVIGTYVGHIDIFPTVCELLNLPRPDFLQGRSLVPMMRGKKGKDEPLTFESLSPHFNMGWAPLRGFISGQKKFIDSPIAEIFNLAKDFEERKNLAERSDLALYRRQLEELAERQSSKSSSRAERRPDRETREKLQSLGYLSSFSGGARKSYGPEDDVKTLLPYHNQAMEALEKWSSGKAQAAIDMLREVLTAKKNISAAYLNLATIFKSQERLEDAIAVLQSGLENLPENYDLFSQYLTYLYEAGQYEEVIRSFTSAQFPRFDFDPVIWNYVGLAHWKKGDDDAARKSYERSVAIDPEFAVPYYNLGTLFAFRFRRQGDRSDYQKSVENYEKAIALDPDYAAAHHGLGVVHCQAEENQAAISHLEKAIQLEPSLDEALLFLGLASLGTRNKEKALDYFLKYKASPSYVHLSSSEKNRLEEYIARARRD